MSMLTEPVFSALAWGSLGLVALVFCYECYIVVTEFAET